MSGKFQNQKKKFKKRVDQLQEKKTEDRHAIAIKYDMGKDKSPKIIASGQAVIADMILKIAEDHKVPLYEDPTLSALLTKLRLNQKIPGELYAIIAEVLAFAYQLESLSKKKDRIMKKITKK